MKVITNVRIFDYKNYIENGYVVFDEKIIEVGPMSKYQDKGVKPIDAGQTVSSDIAWAHLPWTPRPELVDPQLDTFFIS